MRGKLLLAIGALAVMTIAGGVSLADGGCDVTGHQHTAAGSCKDSDDHQIHCGENGKLPVEPAGVNLHVNQTSDGAQVEACSDEGVGNQHGRLIVQLSQSEQGGRVILDSDPDQPFPAGWITAQASGKSGNKSGLYCSRDEGETGTVRGDGYRQSWATPGPDEGADCVPNPPA